MKATTGHLYKRVGGRDLTADHPQAGVFYLRYEVHKRRHVLCLGTSNPETAKSRATEHLSRINTQDREGYLRSLIALGKLAAAELAGRPQNQETLPPDQLWERYEASRRRPQSGPGTLANYRTHVDRFTAWVAARPMRNVARIGPEQAEEYARHLEQQGITPATSRAHLATLGRVWRVLLPETRNPWSGLHPTEAHQVIPYRRLTVDEVRDIAAAAAKLGTEEHALILIGYYTALRIGDAANLDAASYDRQAQTLTITPAKTARRKPMPLTIPVLPGLAAVLPSRDAGSLLPRLSDEQRHRPSELSRRLAELFRTHAGDTSDGKASYHSLRATFVSMMDEAGAPQAVTDAITGHAPQTMHARYSHPGVEVCREWMSKALKRVEVGYCQIDNVSAHQDALAAAGAAPGWGLISA